MFKTMSILQKQLKVDNNNNNYKKQIRIVENYQKNILQQKHHIKHVKNVKQSLYFKLWTEYALWQEYRYQNNLGRSDLFKH